VSRERPFPDPNYTYQCLDCGRTAEVELVPYRGSVRGQSACCKANLRPERKPRDLDAVLRDLGVKA